MGGEGTFSGTSYQAKVIAFIYAHLLTHTRLDWLYPLDDTPLGVQGESGGPGDDVRVELGRGAGALEIQAKSRLQAGASLVEFVSRAHEREKETQTAEHIVLVVDRKSSGKVREEFARDLLRIRTGRPDGLQAVTADLIKAVPGARTMLERLRVVEADVAEQADAETKFALKLLADGLEDPNQALAAWSTLIADANDICARRLRRTRKDLVAILRAAAIQVKPPVPDQKWLRHLDFTKRLIERRHAAAALKELQELERDLGGKGVSNTLRYRLYAQKASAQLQLNRPQAAIDAGRHALEFDSDGVVALHAVAIAGIAIGDTDLAIHHAERAIEVAPNELAGWLAHARVRAALGKQLQNPPSRVSESPQYRNVLAEIALGERDWDTALTHADTALESGIRSVETLFLRAHALMGKVERSGELEPCDAVERHCSEIIESLDDCSHPLTAAALVMRAQARRLLGRVGEADADLLEAEELSPQDPVLIGEKAHASLDRNDRARALEILSAPAVSEAPMLLILRASLQRKDSPALAMKDISAALALLPTSGDQERIRLGAAEVLIEIGDLVPAELLLEEVASSGGSELAYRNTLLGRIAFGTDRPDEGRERLLEAIRLSPSRRIDLLIELAGHLKEAGHSDLAIETLIQIEPADQNDQSRRLLTIILIQNNRLQEAQRVIDEIGDPLPSWALQAGIDLATRQEDHDGVIRRLGELVSRTRDDIPTRIQLARHLIAVDRPSEALEHVEWIRARKDLTPTQFMALAQLVNHLGESDVALALAFKALRAAPSNVEINREYVILHLTSQGNLSIPESVGPNTYVRLTWEDKIREYVVLSDPPYDPVHNEIPTDEATRLGLMGLRLRDTLRRHEGMGWMEEEWKVCEILTASHHALHDVMHSYEERFPSEPFFLKGFSIGDGTSIKDLYPLIASAEARRAEASAAIAEYSENKFPLGLLANRLGVSIPDLLRDLGNVENPTTPVFVEWSDVVGFTHSVQVARGTNLVVTLSALSTIVDCGWLELVIKKYKLIGPRSLVAETKQLAAEAERELSAGRGSVSAAGDGRLVVGQIPAGDPALEERKAKQLAILHALDHVQLHPRPLDTIGPSDSQEEKLRDILGKSESDAMRLAGSLGVPLLTDDLGLRRVALEFGTESTSTVAVLTALADAGVLVNLPLHMLPLLSRGYVFLPPSVEFIETALREAKAERLGSTELDKAFLLLGSPHLDLLESARMGSQLLRRSVTTSLQLEGVAILTRRCLTGMASRWHPRLCAKALSEASETSLMLLPDPLREIRRESSAFARNHSLPI